MEGEQTSPHRREASSFVVHDALAATSGGRFTEVRPAAVELHTCMSVFHDQVVDAELAPGKDPERDFLPEPRELAAKLLLADRGYPSLEHFEQLIDAGAFFVMRAKSDFNPKVVPVRGPGGARPRFEGHHFQDIARWLPRRRLGIHLTRQRPGGRTPRLRMVLIWVAPKKPFRVLVTNLARSVFTAKQVGEV